MLLLASTSDKLQAVTDAAITVDAHVSWNDLLAGAITPGRTNTAITTATTTDILASPAASTQRLAANVNIRNKHATTSVNVTVRHTDGTTIVELYKVLLPAGYTLSYEDMAGWAIGPTVPAGTVEQVITTGTTATVSAPLASDQVVIWQSATAGQKTVTIPTAAGTKRYIRIVDVQGTPTSAAPVVAVPVSGSIVGPAATTDRIMDAYGGITLYDSSIGWVLVS